MEKEIKKVLVLVLEHSKSDKPEVRLLWFTSTESFERRRYQLSIGKPEHRNHSDF